MQKYLEAGKIVNTHGVRGDVKIESYCDSPRILATVKTLYMKTASGYEKLTCSKSQEYKGMVLAHIKGVDDYDAAVALKNKIVYADRDDLHCEEGKYFVADLIGLPVIDNDSGECYGEISDVVNYGAGDIYEINMKNGKKCLVPAIKQFIASVDIEKAVYITPIGGLLE